VNDMIEFVLDESRQGRPAESHALIYAYEQHRRWKLTLEFIASGKVSNSEQMIAAAKLALGENDASQG